MNKQLKKKGFTLIEICLVVGIIGMMAMLVMPRIISNYEPPLRKLQRALEEISDLSVSGISIRLRMEAQNRSDRGSIVVEGLAKAEDPSSPSRERLEWVPLKLQFPIEDANWHLEPELIYFYSDGTCTPGQIVYAQQETRLSKGDAFILTVTGFLFEAPQQS